MGFFRLVALEAVIRFDTKLTHFYSSRALADQLVAYAAGRRSPLGKREQRAQAMIGEALAKKRVHHT